MLLSNADNCTGTVNVQEDASGRLKLIVQTLQILILLLFCLHRRFIFDNRLTGEA